MTSLRVEVHHIQMGRTSIRPMGHMVMRVVRLVLTEMDQEVAHVEAWRVAEDTVVVPTKTKEAAATAGIPSVMDITMELAVATTKGAQVVATKIATIVVQAEALTTTTLRVITATSTTNLTALRIPTIIHQIILEEAIPRATATTGKITADTAIAITTTPIIKAVIKEATTEADTQITIQSTKYLSIKATIMATTPTTMAIRPLSRQITTSMAHQTVCLSTRNRIKEQLYQLLHQTITNRIRITTQGRRAKDRSKLQLNHLGSR
jgi:hypothetical protein